MKKNGYVRSFMRDVRREILFGFLLLAGSAFSQKDMSMEVMGFRVPEYDDQGVMTAQLFGERAEMEGEGDIKITGLRIEFYKAEQTIATVTSPYCFYNRDTREAHSDAPVAVDMDQLKLRGRGFLLKSVERTVQVFNDSEVTIKDGMTQVGGDLVKEVSTNAETVITSKTLFLNYQERTAQFETAVHVKDERMEMFCETLKILLGQDQQINWIGASTGVRILYEEKEALAEEATYDVKNDEFVLKNNPRIIDGKNMLMGETIRLWRASGRMVCEPAARVVVVSDKDLKINLLEK